MKVSESDDMEEAAEAIHRDDVQLCRRLGKVSGVFATILWIFDITFILNCDFLSSCSTGFRKRIKGGGGVVKAVTANV